MGPCVTHGLAAVDSSCPDQQVRRCRHGHDCFSPTDPTQSVSFAHTMHADSINLALQNAGRHIASARSHACRMQNMLPQTPAAHCRRPLRRSTPMLDAGAVAQLLTPPAGDGHEPQQTPALPALSCSSGDRQAMTTKADAASSPPVSVRSGDERQDDPQTHSMLAANGAAAAPRPSSRVPDATAMTAAGGAAAVRKSQCGAMHSPAMTALLGEQPDKGAPDALVVLGIGQHTSGKGPGGWHDVHGMHPAAGAMEAQVRKPRLTSSSKSNSDSWRLPNACIPQQHVRAQGDTAQVMIWYNDALTWHALKQVTPGLQPKAHGQTSSNGAHSPSVTLTYRDRAGVDDDRRAHGRGQLQGR